MGNLGRRLSLFSHGKSTLHHCKVPCFIGLIVIYFFIFYTSQVEYWTRQILVVYTLFLKYIFFKFYTSQAEHWTRQILGGTFRLRQTGVYKYVGRSKRKECFLRGTRSRQNVSVQPSEGVNGKSVSLGEHAPVKMCQSNRLRE